jgi:16S rRNA (cytosine967-C5)-methyltransferase
VFFAKNHHRGGAFAPRDKSFSILPPNEVCAALGDRGLVLQKAAKLSDAGILLTPRRTNTDGFFISVLRRK